MIWSRALVCLVAVISLLLNAIWPNTASAATAPKIVPLGSLEAGIVVPGKLDVDAAGNLYVADIKAQKVLKFDPFGGLLRTFDAVPASGRGLAVTPDGSRLYVATDDQVVILDGVAGTVIGSPIAVVEAGELDLDAAGNLYVVDFANVKVRVYNADGGAVTSFSGYGTANGQFRDIQTMSVNAANAEVYVVGMKGQNDDFATVQIFSLTGVFRGSLTAVGDKLHFGAGVAFDATGREYYLDKLTGKLQVRPRTASADFSAPVVFNISGAGAGQVIQPWDVAFDGLTSRLFVASDSGEIEIFGVDGGVTPEKNVAPGLPTLVSPIANGAVTTLQPQLVFANAFDLNGDSLTYQVRVSGDVVLDYSVAENAVGQTAVQVDRNLSENVTYSWQVKAGDGELESDWTPAQSFYVNSVEEAPTAPVLISPLGGEAMGGAELLKWSAATDFDPLDSINYLLEISATADFAAPAVSEQLAATEVNLGALADYLALTPDSSYFWRVTAVDSEGLKTVSAETGSFRYETAMLSVQANLPGAKVYFGGNAAYAGAYVGTAPLELRDLAAGPYTVVVEAVGCETFIAQVELGAAGSAQVNANLLLAKEPVLKNASTLRSVKDQLKSAALVAPFVIDFDNDDQADLLVGDLDGNVNLFRALATRGSKVQYGAVEAIELDEMQGTSLFVVDWNNDNKKDIVVGTADGSIMIYLQNADSSDLSPEYSFPTYLRDGKGSVINVGAQAQPAVTDIDADGDKDLVIGAGNGSVYLYTNNGTDAAPELAVDAQVLISVASGSVAPYFVDWNADGARDLLVATGGRLIRCAANADGKYTAAETLVNAESGARFFVVDTDNSQGKDVFIGQADGVVKLVRSSGKDFLPSVKGALVAKLGQVETLAADSGVDATAAIGAVKAELEDGNINAAARAAKQVVAISPAGSAMYAAAAELIALLNQ